VYDVIFSAGLPSVNVVYVTLELTLETGEVLFARSFVMYASRSSFVLKSRVELV